MNLYMYDTIYKGEFGQITTRYLFSQRHLITGDLFSLHVALYNITLPFSMYAISMLLSLHCTYIHDRTLQFILSKFIDFYTLFDLKT